MPRLDARPLDVALQERAYAGDVPESAPPHRVLLFEAGAADQPFGGEPVEVRPADSEDPADLGVARVLGPGVGRGGGVVVELLVAGFGGGSPVSV